MEYDCSCGNNYLFVDPLCQEEVIEKLETAIEGIITERNEKAEDSLAIIKMVLKGVSSISKFMPDFGENFVTSLEMDVPADAEDIPYFVENPLLTDLHEYIHWNQSTSTESADCEKCELIDHKISVILSFGFFLLGMCRYSERELIKKIIYLLAPFRRRHREIDKFYDKVWKLSVESKLCSSLYNHIVTFYCQPIEKILSDLISRLSTKEMSITTLPYEESYRNLMKVARKSKNVVCFVTENIAQRFLETHMSILRDFLTYFVSDLKETVLPSIFVKLFSDNLLPFAAFVLENYKDESFIQHHVEILKSVDYKKYIELGISHEKFHYLVENLVLK